MRRVLVVEDDRDTNVSIVEVLEAENFSCFAAYDGEHGLALLVRHEPHLVLLDLDLPGIKGPEFLIRKAAIRAVAEIPVVVMTGICGPARLDNTVALLCKPFTIEELLEIARKFTPASAA